MQHVDLGSSDFVVSVGLVPNSVFVEPVVDLGLGVKWVTEVRGARRRNPVHGAVSSQQVVGELLVAAFIVLLEEAKVTRSLAYNHTKIGRYHGKTVNAFQRTPKAPVKRQGTGNKGGNRGLVDH